MFIKKYEIDEKIVDTITSLENSPKEHQEEEKAEQIQKV